MWLVLLLVGCTRGPKYELTTSHSGSVDHGYGHAVGFSGDDVAVGAPHGVGGGRLFVGSTQVLMGTSGDFLGSALFSGPELLVAAPRYDGGRGAVLRLDGTEALSGGPGEGAGGHPVLHNGQIAAIHSGGVSAGDEGWAETGRLWSLVSATLMDGGSTLVAGRADGSLVGAAGVVASGPPSSLYGFALAACDVDGDSVAELIVGAPGWGEVHVLDAGSGFATTQTIRGPQGFGRSLACGRGLWIGSPEEGVGGTVHLYTDVDSAQPAQSIEATEPGAGLGHAIAAHGTNPTVAVAAPGIGEVRLFDDTRAKR